LVKGSHSLWGKRAKILLPKAGAALRFPARCAPCRAAGRARVPLGYCSGLWTAHLWASEPISLHLWVLLRFLDVPWAPQGLWGSSCLPRPHHRYLAVGQVGGDCGHTDVTEMCPMTDACWWLRGVCPDAMLSVSLACPSARGTRCQGGSRSA